jgi:hypothetical protein
MTSIESFIGNWDFEVGTSFSSQEFFHIFIGKLMDNFGNKIRKIMVLSGLIDY